MMPLTGTEIVRDDRVSRTVRAAQPVHQAAHVNLDRALADAQVSPIPNAPRMRFSRFFIARSYLIRSPRLPRRCEARGSGESIAHQLAKLSEPVLDENEL